MRTDRLEVSRLIEAPPAKVLALLTDPQGDVAIDSSGMLQSADGDLVRAVGDEFVVHMDRTALNDAPLGTYDVTVVITRYEADALLEWTVLSALPPPKPVGHRFGYRLEPRDSNTLVRSSYDWSEMDLTTETGSPSRPSRKPLCAPPWAFWLARSADPLPREA